ncbi:MAG: glyoxylate/hydroxypyruvate reductase A [Magnetovibrio sp.]|nr:glyoxylate/hydroxypyruvate reductase A [Magnetovibrio sp.]
MNVLLIRADETKAWRSALRRHLPEADVYVWGEDDVDKADIDYACVWKPEPGLLATFPNLKGIYNLGAGVDALLQDETLPRDVPLVRLVDPMLSSGMVEYVVHGVLHFHRDMHFYAGQQKAKNWTQHLNANTQKRGVGILGLGELGQDCAHALLMLGFENIAGWSRTEKELPGIQSFAGEDGLNQFLQHSEILVNLLPATKATHRLLNRDTLSKLPKGAFVINAGRGTTVNDDDLIETLNNGQVAAAMLDVFNTEPLPQDHPYWSMNNLILTPHIASLTTPMTAAEIITKGLRDLEDGNTPDNLVDIEQGY